MLYTLLLKITKTVFEAIMVAISFSTLIVSILALSFTFSQKK
ncbi:putative holin-like toxin [Lysinibacillus pakistanensis]